MSSTDNSEEKMQSYIGPMYIRVGAGKFLARLIPDVVGLNR